MDDLEKRLKRIEEQENGGMSWTMRLILIAIAGGLGTIGFFVFKQDQANIKENGVILPQVLLKKASPSRHDLAMLDRELFELAKESDKHLTPKVGVGNKKRSERYFTRLADLKKSSKELEPKLNREEQVVLVATEHAEGLIDRFLKSSFDESLFDHTLIEKAEKQLSKSENLAEGKAASPLLKADKLKEVGTFAKEAADVKKNLDTIRNSKALEQATVAGMDTELAGGSPKVDDSEPHHKRHHKHKAEKEDDDGE